MAENDQARRDSTLVTIDDWNGPVRPDSELARHDDEVRRDERLRLASS